MKILLTGATGYVGGRLLKKLEAEGYAVRCLVRRPEYLETKIGPATQLFRGDMLDPLQTLYAMQGVDAAYYLVHSMGSKGVFDEEERRSAAHFADAAKKSGIKKIIYLGGIGHSDHLSPHLRSRQEVGEVLRTSGVPVIEFRASIILGSGSLSFEMIRALTERLPIMFTPKWVNVLAQPIAIENVIQYLVEAVKLPLDESRIFEIGGPDKMSYADLMKEYGRQRGLKRLIIPLPILSPRFSSLWLGLITPLYARVGRKLIESIRHETTVKDLSAQYFFHVKPMPVSQAIKRALEREDEEFSSTRWSDALSLSPPGWGGQQFGNRLVDARQLDVAVSPAKAFAVIRRIGGKNGWYHADALWKFRGYLDLLFGGIGMRRGRKHPDKLSVGDVVDCWRVQELIPDQKLSLHAEMKMPGRAWLNFETKTTLTGCCITQTAIFDPRGVVGHLYWYILWPFHQFIFGGMLRAIARHCEAQAEDQSEI